MLRGFAGGLVEVVEGPVSVADPRLAFDATG